MNATASTLLFCLSLTVTYLSARNANVQLTYTAVFGLVINSMTFSIYAMARQPMIAQAVVTGIQLSIVFTVLCIGLAYLFRSFRAMELSGQHR